MNSIPSLSVVKKVPTDPVKEVIEALRECLKEAKEGKIRGIVILTAFRDYDGELCTQSNTQYPSNDIYHVLRTALSNTFVRAGMAAVDASSKGLGLVKSPTLDPTDE